MKRGRGINMNGRRHGRIVRAVALFFVLFTVADITLPQYFCGGEEIGGRTLAAMAAPETAGLGSDPGTQAPSPGRDSEAPHEEDCFCCCAHVLPGLAVTPVVAAELRSQQPPLRLDTLPSPPLSLQYHPPRFA